MWRYNRLIKKGFIPIVADNHYLDGLCWTNVLMGKGLKRKSVRLDGTWKLAVLQDNVKEKNETL